MLYVKEFFDFANERERIRIAKEAGEPRPWTKDKVLDTYAFCNIFREDDKVSVWFRENIREPMRDRDDIISTTVLFRLLNHIEAGSRIAESLLQGWDADLIRSAMDGCTPTSNAAYIIATPPGMCKLEGILQIAESVRKAEIEFVIGLRDDENRDGKVIATAQEVHAWLMTIDYIGPFIAYEVTTDLYHTWVLEHADRRAWASLGPGSARGLEWCLGTGAKLNYTTKKWQTFMMELVRQLLDASDELWDWPDKPWDARTVEHSLCEFDKWRRGTVNGQRLKRRYAG